MKLKNVSIKHKLTLINLVTIGVTLVLIAVVAIVGQVQMLRQSLLNDIDLQAKIIASNSTASLAFNDWKTAAEILSALGASSDTVYAAIYTPDGSGVAEYRRNGTGARTFSFTEEKEAHFFSADRMATTHAISLSGENIGTVYIESDLEQLKAATRRLVMLGIAVLLAAFGITFLLLRKLQQKITDPLLGLTRLMQQVSKDKSYSIRSTFSGQDEIGMLAQGFNFMLAQIEARDEALAQHRAHLENEVAQRTAKLTEAQRIAHLGSWEWDIASNTLLWSDETFRIFGVEPQQSRISHDVFLQAVHPDDRQIVDGNVREALERRQPYSLDHRILLPDGTVRHVHEQAEVVCDEGGQPTGMVGTVLDITERKIAEKKLNENREILERMFENTHFHVVLLDPQFNFIRVNKAYADACGYTPDSFAGKNHFALYPSEELEAKFRNVVETGIPYTAYARPFEWPDKPELGTTYWDLAVHPVKAGGSKVEGILFTLLEVTERKKIEEERLRAEARFRTVFDNAGDAIFIHEVQGRFLEVNQVACDRLGYSRDELLRLSPRDIDAPEEMAKFPQRLEVILAQGRITFEAVHVTRSGQHVPVEINACLTDFAGQQAVLSVVRDVTERRQYIEGLRKAQELAEEIATAKSNFLANMSHEIRTPMNAIIGLSQLALNKQTSAEVRNYLEKILNSSSSLMDILNDVLDLSKLEAGRMVVEHGAFDLNAVLENLDCMFAARAEEKYLDFNIEASPGIPRDLVGDALRLQQVLANLLGNAIKFTERGSVALKISLKQANERQLTLRFCVEDTGIGIAGDDIGKLFRPFNQLDGSITRRFGGTGLGLSISHNLLQLMGGEFSVESTPGKGSAFCFELVLGIAPQATHGKLAQHRRGAGALASELRVHGHPLAGAHILVVEDDAINQQVAREFLELAGVAVTIAGNGMEALEQLGQDRFDAVLMDVHMPVMNGIETTKRIRAYPHFANLPVIALTADMDSEGHKTYLAAGMNDFVAKPIHPNELVTALLRWIKRDKGAAQLPKNSTPETGMTETGMTETSRAEATQPVAGNHHGLDKLPGFELDNILKMLNGNREQLTRLLTSFMDDKAGAADEIVASVTAGDFHAAYQLAHKLKGTSGTMGAKRLHAAIVQLERELKAGRHNPAALDAFREEFNFAMSAIAGLHPTEKHAPTPGHAGDTATLTNVALKLDKLLEENDFVADELLDELKKNLPADKLSQFDALRQHIKNIKYANARQTLRALVEFPEGQEH